MIKDRSSYFYLNKELINSFPFFSYIVNLNEGFLLEAVEGLGAAFAAVSAPSIAKNTPFELLRWEEMDFLLTAQVLTDDNNRNNSCVRSVVVSCYAIVVSLFIQSGVHSVGFISQNGSVPYYCREYGRGTSRCTHSY